MHCSLAKSKKLHRKIITLASVILIGITHTYVCTRVYVRGLIKKQNYSIGFTEQFLFKNCLKPYNFINYSNFIPTLNRVVFKFYGINL